MRILILVLVSIWSVSVNGATIYNNIPRLDTDGNIIDCHSGNIVYQNNVFYIYGNNTGFGEKTIPVLHVYSSPDMITWVHHGPMIQNAPIGTYFTPYVVYNEKTKYFVAWFNAYFNQIEDGCCTGNFGVARSLDGINFEIVTMNEEAYYPTVDCNAILVDDDGNAYLFYSSETYNHSVSIELLTPDYLHTTKQNYGFFPDAFVEGTVLFKRNGIYYAGYGSCCCFCRAGSGFVLYSSKDIKGPWTRMGNDKNCNSSDIEVCGTMGYRVQGQLIIPAQGISVSVLPTNGGPTYLWQAERWLSAPYNNPECPSECQAQTGVCQEPDNYIKGHGYSYWYPLEFTSTGDVNQFSPFLDSFDLNFS